MPCGIRDWRRNSFRLVVHAVKILESPPKPSSQLKPVEPQRRLHERLENPLALRCVEPLSQPSIIAVNKSTRRIS
jgi:hypothetical protein